MERPRPGALTVLAVFAIVLGSLISLGGLYSIGELAFQGTLFELGHVPDDPDGRPEVQARIERLRHTREQMFEVQQSWNPVSWAVAPLSILFAIGLLAGGILSFKLSRTGRKLLAAVFGTGLVFDLFRGWVAITITLQKTAVLNQMLIDEAASGSGGQVNTDFVGVAAGFGMTLTGAWLVIKLGIYLWGLIYLTRPRVRDLFELGVGF